MDQRKNTAQSSELDPMMKSYLIKTTKLSDKLKDLKTEDEPTLVAAREPRLQQVDSENEISWSRDEIEKERR